LPRRVSDYRGHDHPLGESASIVRHSATVPWPHWLMTLSSVAALLILREAYFGFQSPKPLQAPWQGLAVNGVAAVHHIKLGHRYSRKKQSGMSNGKLGAHLYHAVGWQAKVARCIVAESREMHQ
jgi:hypothetical protein